MMWRWETKELSRTRHPHQRRARAIVVWQTGPSCLSSNDGPRVAWRNPVADISTLFGQAVGQCHTMGPLPRLIRRNFSSIQLGQ
jgi:hypothetical protein